MVATLANEECRRLYAVKEIKLYAALKDSIYARYRMLAEMLGISQSCTESVWRQNDSMLHQACDLAVPSMITLELPRNRNHLLPRGTEEANQHLCRDIRT
eukprot:COSAG02_NODE_2325_length_9132_cov_16.589752_3_plen_100_part_00